MYVVDEATGKIIPENRCIEVVVGYSSGQLIWGFVNKKEAILPVLYIIKDGVENLPSYEKAVRDIIFFSNSKGLYMCKEGLTEMNSCKRCIPWEREISHIINSLGSMKL